MLKQFIACKNQIERFRFFDASKLADWTEEELDAVAQIIGISFEQDTDIAQKYMKLCNALLAKTKQIA